MEDRLCKMHKGRITWDNICKGQNLHRRAKWCWYTDMYQVLARRRHNIVTPSCEDSWFRDSRGSAYDYTIGTNIPFWAVEHHQFYQVNLLKVYVCDCEVENELRWFRVTVRNGDQFVCPEVALQVYESRNSPIK